MPIWPKVDKANTHKNKSYTFKTCQTLKMYALPERIS